MYASLTVLADIEYLKYFILRLSSFIYYYIKIKNRALKHITFLFLCSARDIS